MSGFSMLHRALRRVHAHRGEAVVMLVVLALVSLAAGTSGLTDALRYTLDQSLPGTITGALLVGFASLWMPLMVIDMRRCTRETRLREQVQADLHQRLAEEQRTTARRQELTARTLDVLETRGPRIALQPIIELSTNHCIAVEALARFPGPQPPNKWFADALEVGLGPELELAAVNGAIARLDELPPSVGMSVNVSPHVVLDARFTERLNRPDVPLHRLTIEITEHDAVAQYDQLTHVLAPFRRRGLRVAVDDTGAGFASFQHVLQLHPDCIKVDRSLISHIDRDPARRALVTALVLLACELNASVTAEGVETVEELHTVESLGVHCAQGYLLGHPTLEAGPIVELCAGNGESSRVA